jgi:peptidoglycan hydrolase-like protein with peptidoglycan-binding domain
MARVLLNASPMLRGDDVAALQRLVAKYDIGTGVFVDGAFGPRTGAALSKFQSASGERPTGFADEAFQTRWGISGAPSPFKTPSSAPAAAAVTETVTPGVPTLPAFAPAPFYKTPVFVIGTLAVVGLIGLALLIPSGSPKTATAGIGSWHRSRLSRRKKRGKSRK